MTNFTYIGIDETTLSLSHTSLIICAAVSNNPKLAEYKGYGELKKSRDLLKRFNLGENVSFPTYKQMQDEGLSNFHWTRSNGGKSFNRQEIPYLSIAELIVKNNYNPKTTVLLIDTFDQKIEYS